MDKLLVICGPTATGKTALALKIASLIPTDVVSADSRQVYRGMDIGTGKDLPKDAVRSGLTLEVPYDGKTVVIRPYVTGSTRIWMYDVIDPDEPFSTAHFVSMVRPILQRIRDDGRLPIIAGGTGLYIDALVSGIDTIGIPPDEKLRRELSAYPIGKLQARLRAEYPDVWSRLNASDRQNPRRLIRKLEISRTLRPDKEIISGQSADTYTVGLTAPTDYLYPRINARVRKRMTDGLLDEISVLRSRSYSFSLRSFSSLGYRQWKPWFDGSVPQTVETQEEIIKKWQYLEHAYARRQLTWFKKIPGIRWYDIRVDGYEKNIEDDVLSWYTV